MALNLPKNTHVLNNNTRFTTKTNSYVDGYSSYSCNSSCSLFTTTTTCSEATATITSLKKNSLPLNEKFINLLMKNGNKLKANRIFYNSLRILYFKNLNSLIKNKMFKTKHSLKKKINYSFSAKHVCLALALQKLLVCHPLVQHRKNSSEETFFGPPLLNFPLCKAKGKINKVSSLGEESLAKRPSYGLFQNLLVAKQLRVFLPSSPNLSLLHNYGFAASFCLAKRGSQNLGLATRGFQPAFSLPKPLEKQHVTKTARKVHTPLMPINLSCNLPCAVLPLYKKREMRDNLVLINANKLFIKAIDNVKPSVETRNVKVSGVTYPVPAVISKHRQQIIAIRWLIECATKNKKNTSMSFSECLASELYEAFCLSGKVKQKRDAMHKHAEYNRAYIRFKWW